ncbi:hypothetical protein FI667_g15986, partial [Globisporangium splendens]
MSPHAPASQVAGGMRPVRVAPEQEEGDTLVAAGLGDSSEEEEEGEPRPKRRRLRRVDEGDEQEEEKEEEFEEHVVARVLNRRGDGSLREYLIQWEDQSSEWMAVADLGNCFELLKAYDRYLEEHPERNVSYAEFVSSDLPSIQLMADSPKDDCALHAVQMAFELMGGLDRDVVTLRRRSEKFLRRMTLSDSGRFGGLKYSQLVKFLREEVPHTGWRISLDVFNRNWYTGKGSGPLGVAQLAWRAVDPIEDGVYLVYALKTSRRGHCIAMKKEGGKMVVRENGVTQGIMTQTWIRSICTVRRILLRFGAW